MKRMSPETWEQVNAAGFVTLNLNKDYYLKYLQEWFKRSCVSPGRLKTLLRNINIANEVWNSNATLREVADKYELSPERVRQIANKQLRMYRRYYKNYVETEEL